MEAKQCSNPTTTRRSAGVKLRPDRGLTRGVKVREP
jgi:hypothetical protein